jgi:hypothetical protein
MIFRVAKSIAIGTIDGMKRKILIMGLPGAGKTTLASVLAKRLGAVHFNADEVRKFLNKDLGFSIEDRIEQATRMSFLCDLVTRSGGTAIADFVCPTPATRAAFGPGYVIWIDRIKSGRFADTNQMFIPPQTFDIRVAAEGSPDHWAEMIHAELRPAPHRKWSPGQDI